MAKKPTNETLEMRKDFQEFIFEHFHLSQDDEITDLRTTLEKMAECIDKWCNPLKSIDELISYIEEQQIYYIPNYDKICIIIDRNKRNLKVTNTNLYLKMQKLILMEEKVQRDI